MINPFHEENFSRNLAGVPSLIVGGAIGIGIAAAIFGLSHSQVSTAGEFFAVINLAIYADFYHKSITSSMPVSRFVLAAFVSAIPAAFVLGFLSRYAPF
ncbi:MAG: hypothetical protein Q8922_08645 [Bacteroidota bacterium]|nr:hypothetical protein [Bacteroidota bacterium]MDP4243306.1 hypothetical protein [Bacteroidota bacterium]MDP4287991.1 hypothetical protein [Bacteroidota bacterium]